MLNSSGESSQLRGNSGAVALFSDTKMQGLFRGYNPNRKKPFIFCLNPAKPGVKWKGGERSRKTVPLNRLTSA
jgi:hypothetical protein